MKNLSAYSALLALAFPAVLLANAPAPVSAPRAGDDAKPYSLFMGADFSVAWKGAQRPVLDVEGGNFVVDVDGRRESVPARGNLTLGIKPVLKVSRTGIAIAKLEAKRAYTKGNDPGRWQQMAMTQMEVAEDAADRAQATLDQAYTSQAMANTIAMDNAAVGIPPPPDLGPSIQDGMTSVGNADGAMADMAGQMADFSARGGIEKMQERYDAFSLTFDISSPRPIRDPYLVMVVLLRPDPHQPKSIKEWVYAQQLDSIGPKPQSFSMVHGGLPPGYQLIAVQLHLYQAGMELDTTAAPKRLEITGDDAFEFSVADYVGRHRGATLVPVAVQGGVSQRLRSGLAAGELDRTYYLRISRNGRPLGAFADQDCANPLGGSDLATALLAMRFYPALQAGKPIEAVVAVRP